MNELFGIPMTTFATILVVLLAICLLIVAYIALRKPVVFKMGLRSIPRRPAQTILIVIGLMLSTLIVASALGVGDTLDTLGARICLRPARRNRPNHRHQRPRRGGYLSPATTSPKRNSPMSRLDSRECQTSTASCRPSIRRSPRSMTRHQLANSQVFITGLDPSRLGPFGGSNPLMASRSTSMPSPRAQWSSAKALSEDLGAQGWRHIYRLREWPADRFDRRRDCRNSALLGFGNNPDGTTNSSAFCHGAAAGPGNAWPSAAS